MATKKSSAAPAKKKASKPIVIQLKEGFSAQDVQDAITPQVHRALKTAHKTADTVTLMSQKIPGR